VLVLSRFTDRRRPRPRSRRPAASPRAAGSARGRVPRPAEHLPAGVRRRVRSRSREACSGIQAASGGHTMTTGIPIQAAS